MDEAQAHNYWGCSRFGGNRNHHSYRSGRRVSFSQALSVSAADGRMLRLIPEAVNAKYVAEIGTSTGYSGLWICLALQSTGGNLTTFEIDRGRAKPAREHYH
jgi:predicted O-methyltransferase YrrM